MSNQQRRVVSTGRFAEHTQRHDANLVAWIDGRSKVRAEREAKKSGDCIDVDCLQFVFAAIRSFFTKRDVTAKMLNVVIINSSSYPSSVNSCNGGLGEIVDADAYKFMR